MSLEDQICIHRTDRDYCLRNENRHLVPLCKWGHDPEMRGRFYDTGNFLSNTEHA